MRAKANLVLCLLVGVAPAFALFVSPFDKNLTSSTSCSTFLKTTFEMRGRRMSLSPAVSANGSPMIGGSIRQS